MLLCVVVTKRNPRLHRCRRVELCLQLLREPSRERVSVQASPHILLPVFKEGDRAGNWILSKDHSEKAQESMVDEFDLINANYWRTGRKGSSLDKNLKPNSTNFLRKQNNTGQHEDSGIKSQKMQESNWADDSLCCFCASHPKPSNSLASNYKCLKSKDYDYICLPFTLACRQSPLESKIRVWTLLVLKVHNTILKNESFLACNRLCS